MVFHNITVMKSVLQCKIITTTDVDIYHSNFTTVILASDGSLWAMGLGEHDRNANPVPLRVQTDFHHPLPPGAVAAATSACFVHNVARGEADAEDASKVYIVVPMSDTAVGAPIAADLVVDMTATIPTLLRKGHQRVTLVVAEGAERSSVAVDDAIIDAGLDPAFPSQGLYEVVVHQGEAYLIRLQLPLDHREKEEDGARGGGGKWLIKGAGSVDSPSVTGGTGSKFRLVDYSSGWKHSLLVVKNV